MVACCVMGWGLFLIGLRATYVLAAIVKISPLVDSCESTWASVLESPESAPAMQLIQGLCHQHEQEAETQRILVSESEQEHKLSSVWGVIQDHLKYMRFDSNLGVSYEPKVPPRHLLLECNNINGYDISSRAMYHRAAAQTLAEHRMHSVNCLDQLYFQVFVPLD